MARLPVGVLLLLALAIWAYLAHPLVTDAPRTAAALVLLAVAVVLGAMLAGRHPLLPGVLVLVGGLGAVAVTAPASLSGGPLAPPLEYGGSNGALALAAVAGPAAASASGALPRPVAPVLAVAGAVLCVVQQARAAAVAALLLAVLAPLVRRGATWLWQAAGGVLVLAPAVVTAALGTGVWGGEWATRALSDERVALWSDAWHVTLAHPVRGVGPGLLPAHSDVAADPDLRWAHSVTLQVAADLGLVGLLLLALVLGWAVVAAGRLAPVVGVLLLPMSVDHVSHDGWVLAAVGVVVGSCVVLHADHARIP